MMPFTVDMARVRSLLNGIQSGLQTGRTDDELLLIDMWDRESFGQFVGHEFTVEEWEDFVDFCSHEQIPWAEWFAAWRDNDKRA